MTLSQITCLFYQIYECTRISAVFDVVLLSATVFVQQAGRYLDKLRRMEEQSIEKREPPTEADRMCVWFTVPDLLFVLHVNV